MLLALPDVKTILTMPSATGKATISTLITTTTTKEEQQQFVEEL